MELRSWGVQQAHWLQLWPCIPERGYQPLLRLLLYLCAPWPCTVYGALGASCPPAVYDALCLPHALMPPCPCPRAHALMPMPSCPHAPRALVLSCPRAHFSLVQCAGVELGMRVVALNHLPVDGLAQFKVRTRTRQCLL